MEFRGRGSAGFRDRATDNPVVLARDHREIRADAIGEKGHGVCASLLNPQIVEHLAPRTLFAPIAVFRNETPPRPSAKCSVTERGDLFVALSGLYREAVFDPHDQISVHLCGRVDLGLHDIEQFVLRS